MRHRVLILVDTPAVSFPKTFRSLAVVLALLGSLVSSCGKDTAPELPQDGPGTTQARLLAEVRTICRDALVANLTLPVLVMKLSRYLKGSHSTTALRENVEMCLKVKAKQVRKTESVKQ